MDMLSETEIYFTKSLICFVLFYLCLRFLRYTLRKERKQKLKNKQIPKEEKQKVKFVEKADLNKELVLKILSSVRREGMDKLTDHLIKSNHFYKEYEGTYSRKGGLVSYNLNLYDAMVEYNKEQKLDIPADTLLLVCFCHELEGDDESVTDTIQHYIDITELEYLVLKWKENYVDGEGNGEISSLEADVYKQVIGFSYIKWATGFASRFIE